MKVLCIDSTKYPGEVGEVLIKEGEIYTVIDTRPGYDSYGVPLPCYELSEIPEPYGCNLYACNRFIPLQGEPIEESELSEIELDELLQVG